MSSNPPGAVSHSRRQGSRAGQAGCATPRASFGVRVETIDQLLGGRISRESACAVLSITEEKLDEYLREHARDRVMSLAELRMPSVLGPGMHELWSRAKVLESLLRDRHRELVLLRQIARGKGLL